MFYEEYYIFYNGKRLSSDGQYICFNRDRENIVGRVKGKNIYSKEPILLRKPSCREEGYK